VAIVSIALALFFRLRLLGFRQAARSRAARMDSALLLRDAVISAGRECVAVLNAGAVAPLSFAGGNARLNACLRGPDSAIVAAKLNALLQSGIPFALTALAPDGRRYAVRACPVGAHAAVYIREDVAQTEAVPGSDAVLEALPFPVWIRGKDLSLRWANHAFLAATNSSSLQRAVQWNAALGDADRDLARAARCGREIVDARQHTVIAGQVRSLAYSMRPLENGEVAAVAMDVTETNPSNAELQERAQLEIDSLNMLSTAVAIFSRDRRLVLYNVAYARLWGLSETWLDTHPAKDEILERLREARLLPERRDFAAWKRDRLKLFEAVDGEVEELWHLASGKSLRVDVRRHVSGGLVFTYEDISERLNMESAYQSVVKVQKALLDALRECVAVFGPDGRLKTCNAAFAKLWLLSESDLTGEPHMNRLADLCAARIGNDEFWDIVRSGVAAGEPERANEWGLMTRADGRPLSLSLARLPDGSTLLTVREVPRSSDVAPAPAEQAAA
jgi:PAS domain-containing protein